MSVIIIGEYMGKSRIQKSVRYELFHFKGVCKGVLIKGVYICGLDALELEQKTEYLVYLDQVFMENHYVLGKMSKIKPVFNILI